MAEHAKQIANSQAAPTADIKTIFRQTMSVLRLIITEQNALKTAINRLATTAVTKTLSRQTRLARLLPITAETAKKIVNRMKFKLPAKSAPFFMKTKNVTQKQTKRLLLSSLIPIKN